ncbi:MAG: type II toxin-antitoxin system PemK/MazF family toxin [Methanosarcinales archaeon]|uniref:Type II toxin-antitoxin system PemK/MazF family toxin n=1 Tax=Candidatus Ethanoperedens thermophilum TaxID=2766897 RepID=A0A848DBB2_9EURY|nr:type II toxin-antitoxin system PemK/MazF family toxin [Candidatus Ethanoperedens thermophilum]
MMSGRDMQRKSLLKSEIAQGDVILVDFSYSDLQRSKFRPALVMSKSGYNSKSPDIVVLRITSKHRRRWAVKLTNEDLESGILEVDSYVKVDSRLSNLNLSVQTSSCDTIKYASQWV